MKAFYRRSAILILLDGTKWTSGPETAPHFLPRRLLATCPEGRRALWRSCHQPVLTRLSIGGLGIPCNNPPSKAMALTAAVLPQQLPIGSDRFGVRRVLAH